MRAVTLPCLVDDSLAAAWLDVFSPVVVPDPECNEEGEEEENGVQNAEREARFQHSACLVQGV